MSYGLLSALGWGKSVDGAQPAASRVDWRHIRCNTIQMVSFQPPSVGGIGSRGLTE